MKLAGFYLPKWCYDPMLNEHVDFNNLYLIVTLSGIAFLSVMGGGFLYFSRLKKKDEEKRAGFKSVIQSIDSED
jgi:hypothetical protein